VLEEAEQRDERRTGVDRLAETSPPTGGGLGRRGGSGTQRHADQGDQAHELRRRVRRAGWFSPGGDQRREQRRQQERGDRGRQRPRPARAPSAVGRGQQMIAEAERAGQAQHRQLGLDEGGVERRKIAERDGERGRRQRHRKQRHAGAIGGGGHG